MFKIVQISDLHFGREDQRAILAGENIIADLNPDLIVVAGDLTQRNWSWEFFNAVKFLKKLNRPIVIVPGNHDMPLFNLFLRFRKPLSHYNRHFNLPNMSVFENDFINIIGLNSSNGFQLKNGKLRKADIENTLKNFKNQPDKWNILVTHHPLSHIKNNNDPALINEFMESIDLWLCGHLHRFKVENSQFQNKKFHCVQCISGTFISKRLRSEPNSFNLFEFEKNQTVLVTQYILHATENEFIKAEKYPLVRL